MKPYCLLAQGISGFIFLSLKDIYHQKLPSSLICRKAFSPLLPSICDCSVPLTTFSMVQCWLLSPNIKFILLNYKPGQCAETWVVLPRNIAHPWIIYLRAILGINCSHLWGVAFSSVVEFPESRKRSNIVIFL